MNYKVGVSGRRRGAAGFSLIEILVALGVLVIGVLGILRIFPYGFLSIQRTNEQTHASALANQLLETEKNSASVPESIVAMSTDGLGTISSNILPDDLNPLDNYGSDVNKIRYVMGETFRIPTAFGSPVALGGTNPAYGAVYIAQFGPIYYNPTDATDPTKSDPQNPKVTGTPMQRLEQSSIQRTGEPSSTPPLTSAGQYAIDYDNLKIAFYPRIGTGSRKFQFNYSYYTTATGETPTVQIAMLTIIVNDLDPKTPNEQIVPIWQLIFDTTAPNNNPAPMDIDPKLGIVRESEDVSRAFALLNAVPAETSGVAPSWSDDPYEYVLYTANAAQYANVGVFLFNPRGHNETTATATGTQPLSARISYQIYDNHIIRDQRSIPSAPPYDARLSLPYVSINDDVQLDQTKFSGLFGAATDPAILVYNANSGGLITKGAGECTPGTAVNPDNFTLDAKTGVVHFDQSFIETNKLQNTTFRFYYHTQKNYGIQLQKANAHYRPADSQATANTIYNNYYVGPNATRIYFAPCELGKTVSLGILNYVDKAGNNQHSSGETYQIINTGSTQPYIDITARHTDAASFADPTKDPTKGLIPVENVTGVSMKARVIWLRSVQVTPNANPPVAPVYHWRKVDNDTILLPSATR